MSIIILDIIVNSCTLVSLGAGVAMMIFRQYVPSPTVVHAYRLVLEPVPALPRLPVAPLPPLPLLTPALPLSRPLPFPLALPLPRPLVLISSLELSPSSPEAPSRLEEESLSLAVASLSSRLASSSLLLLSSLSESLYILSALSASVSKSDKPSATWSASKSLAMIFVTFVHEITVDRVEIRASK